MHCLSVFFSIVPLYSSISILLQKRFIVFPVFIGNIKYTTVSAFFQMKISEFLLIWTNLFAPMTHNSDWMIIKQDHLAGIRICRKKSVEYHLSDLIF